VKASKGLSPAQQEGAAENQMVIKSAHGAFHACIARPAKLPSPTVVVLQELFGVNADIRGHAMNWRLWVNRAIDLSA
jgi:hypothetical protein